MFYQEALNYIRNIERAGSDYGIERMRELLVLLGNPDCRLKIVHIAGTNGKGSVCAYLTSVFVSAGYKVGTYNSPSVLNYNERFLLNGKPFDDGQVAKYMTVVRNAIESEQELREKLCRHGESEKVELNGRTIDRTRKFTPTAFEIETALALAAFDDMRCDICVLETGLGGRWDATNAVDDKELAVITSIGYDHCALLGNTLREIASEKAAIIHDAAVSCPQEKEAEEVLKEKGAVFTSQATAAGSSLAGQSFVYDGEEYFVTLKGAHQIVNASLAIEAVKALRNKGWNISEQALKEGLKKAVWRVRFEVLDSDNIAKSPYKVQIPHGKVLVLDGAHNPQGAQALRAAIEEYLADKRIYAVSGVLADKDFRKVMGTLLPLFDGLITVTPSSPRALDGKALADIAKEVAPSLPVEVVPDVATGVARALEKDCDAVVVFGSLTLFCELTK